CCTVRLASAEAPISSMKDLLSSELSRHNSHLSEKRVPHRSPASARLYCRSDTMPPLGWRHRLCPQHVSARSRPSRDFDRQDRGWPSRVCLHDSPARHSSLECAVPAPRPCSESSESSPLSRLHKGWRIRRAPAL